MARRELTRLFRFSRTQPRLSRRDALKQLACGTAAWVLSRPAAAAFSQTPGRRVLIVGAGFSGLACAYELRAAGCDVQVFEARSRIGGRVSTVRDLIPGKTLEAGGELLGSNHPTVLAYAEKFGLTFLDVPDDDADHPSPVEIQGRRLTAAEIEETQTEIESAYERITDEARNIIPERPWESPQAVERDHLKTSDWIDKLAISPLAKSLLALQFTADNSVSVTQQSFLGNLAQIRGGGLERYWEESEVYRCAGGNQQFASKLADGIGNERITLGCPITEISIKDNRVVLIDASGRRHEGDHVVLSVPPSIWSKIRFNPSLPDDLLPQMGAAVKTLAAVKGPFWQSAGLSPAGHGDGSLSYVWWGTAGQSDQRPGEGLVGFTGGPEARTQANLAAELRDSRFQELMQAWLPGFEASVTKTRFINWVQDPWTLAGYSFPGPGQVTTHGPRLQAGLGRLHFAGEHTCYQFVGYMEGALHSGVDVARRILMS